MKNVTQFIQDVAGELPSDQVRAIRSRLKLADITTVVKEADEVLAREIIEDSLQKTAGTVRTAAVAGCPQCNTAMVSVKLADSANATFCPNCHVVVPL